MDKRFSRMIESGTRLTFVVMLLFAAVTCIKGHWGIGIAELLVVALLYLYYRRSNKRRSAEIRKYVENLAFSVDDASKHSMVNFPLPMAIIRIDTGEIVWGNDQFGEISGKKDSMFETHITDVLHGFDTRWIMEGKTLCAYDVEMGERKYQVYGNMVRSGRSRGSSLLATLFWVDTTDYLQLRDYVERTRPVVGIIVIDSYEELVKNASEAEKSTLTADIDRHINEWAKPAKGIVRRLERDRYLFIFEQHSLLDFTAGKFSILESIHEVQNSEGLSATLSIGVGKGECSLQELYQFAALGIDMALSRGGDQAVVKTKTAFEFYGGRSKELEKRTKVKSRVMANALMQLIKDSSQVFLMGHKYSDLDSIGACAGLVAAVRKAGRPAYIIVNDQATSAKELIDRLRRTPQYEGVFISQEDAIVKADAGSLCVVCDTTRPDMVEGPDLLDAIHKIAVVDHHRRAADYINPVVVNLHEPYASSAAELATELLQYAVEKVDVLPIEAKSLMAGIFLDTKSFNVRTGERTFEAAAALRRMGADTTEIKLLLQSDFQDTMAKYQIIKSARLYRQEIAIAALNTATTRVLAAQAADELLNISGIAASFVLYPDGDTIYISARSIGTANVQMILEPLGGGGNTATAGAQLRDTTVKDALDRLVESIDKFYEQ